MTMVVDVATASAGAGPLLRTWRSRRRLSQLELASAAEVSTRHLSFVETGRSKPSRELLMHLADRLDVPLRERNTLLLAGGFAPAYREAPFDAPALAPVRDAVRTLLAAHEPNPALVVDRHWNLLDANAASALLIDGVAAELLEAPVNVLRLSTHPDGLRRLVTDGDAALAGLLRRVQRQAVVDADRGLLDLVAEVEGYLPTEVQGATPSPGDGIVDTLTLRTPRGPVRLFTTIATIGTPQEVTTAELAIETFLPADAASARTLAVLADDRGAAGR